MFPYKLITHRSDCLLFGDFNSLKVNSTTYSPPPQKKTADSQLLDFATESLLCQCVHAPTRFRVNQVPSPLDLLLSNSLALFPQSRVLKMDAHVSCPTTTIPP